MQNLLLSLFSSLCLLPPVDELRRLRPSLLLFSLDPLFRGCVLAACSSGVQPFVMSQMELAGTPWDSPPLPFPAPPRPPPGQVFIPTDFFRPGQRVFLAEGCKQRVKFSEVTGAFQIIDHEGVVVPQESGTEMN